MPLTLAEEKELSAANAPTCRTLERPAPSGLMTLPEALQQALDGLDEDDRRGVEEAFAHLRLIYGEGIFDDLQSHARRLAAQEEGDSVLSARVVAETIVASKMWFQSLGDDAIGSATVADLIGALLAMQGPVGSTSSPGVPAGDGASATADEESLAAVTTATARPVAPSPAGGAVGPAPRGEDEFGGDARGAGGPPQAGGGAAGRRPSEAEAPAAEQAPAPAPAEETAPGDEQADGPGEALEGEEERTVTPPARVPAPPPAADDDGGRRHADGGGGGGGPADGDVGDPADGQSGASTAAGAGRTAAEAEVEVEAAGAEAAGAAEEEPAVREPPPAEPPPAEQQAVPEAVDTVTIPEERAEPERASSSKAEGLVSALAAAAHAVIRAPQGGGCSAGSGGNLPFVDNLCAVSEHAACPSIVLFFKLIYVLRVGEPMQLVKGASLGCLNGGNKIYVGNPAGTSTSGGVVGEPGAFNKAVKAAWQAHEPALRGQPARRLRAAPLVPWASLLTSSTRPDIGDSALADQLPVGRLLSAQGRHPALHPLRGAAAPRLLGGAARRGHGQGAGHRQAALWKEVRAVGPVGGGVGREACSAALPVGRLPLPGAGRVASRGAAAPKA